MVKITRRLIRSQKREAADRAQRLRALWHKCAFLSGNRARIVQLLIDDEIEGLGYTRERDRQRRILTELERAKEAETQPNKCVAAFAKDEHDER